MSTKITVAELNNFQKVSYAKIEPSGNVIVLAGKNGAGKTSTNDALEAGLCGHNGRNIKRPVKDGHGKASIELKLSDGSTLIRGYTPSGTTLKGLDAAGNKFGQKDLDDRISSLGIDGRKFISMGEKDQLKALLSIVDLPFDPAALDAERKAIEAKRLAVGQQGKLIGEVTINPALPAEETSAGDIIANIRAAEDAKRARVEAENAKQVAAHNVAQIKAELVRLTGDLANWETTLLSRSVAVDELPATVDTTALEQQLAAVEETNLAVRVNNAARQQSEQKDTLRARYNEHTAELEAIDKRKADGLATAEMPIEGLTFDEEGVLYQGVPFSRASGREQLIVSCAMIMATNPEIRVIVIRDGNVLDMEGMALLQDMAEATDFQIFIELVAEEAGDNEYFFVDGELAS